MTDARTMSCRGAREAMSARLDDELGPDETDRLEAHLDACPGCRTELRILRADAARRRAAFAVCQRSAPPAPAGLPRRRVPRRVGWRIAAGIVLTLLAGGAGLFIGIGGARPASAASAFVRAAENWLGHDDAELELDVEAAFIGSNEPIDRVSLEVFITHSAKLLIREAGESPSPIAGSNGETVWAYDPRRELLRIASAAEHPVRLDGADFSLEIHGDLREMVSYLTRDLVRELRDLAAERGSAVRVRRAADGELTYSFRYGQREGAGSLGSSRATVVVDPDRRRIVRMRMRTRVAGMFVVRSEMRTVRVDAGLPDAFFEPRTHAPPGTTIEPAAGGSP